MGYEGWVVNILLTEGGVDLKTMFNSIILCSENDKCLLFLN